MRFYLVALALVGTAILTACSGSASTPTATSLTATASPSARTPAATPVGATATITRPPATPLATATTAPAGESGIEGVVTIGPTCPVQRIDSPCPDRPYAAEIIVLDGARKRVAGVASGADGRFRILLPPGVYTLSPQHKNALSNAPEQLVTVVAGRITSVQIVFDSGIR